MEEQINTTKQSPLVKTTSESETVKSLPQPTPRPCAYLGTGSVYWPQKYVRKYSCNDVFCFEAESKCLGGKRCMFFQTQAASVVLRETSKTVESFNNKHQDLTQLTVGGSHGGNHGDTSSVQPCIHLYKLEVRK